MAGSIDPPVVHNVWSLAFKYARYDQEVGLTAPGLMDLPPPLGKLWVGEFRAETSPAWSWRGPLASSDCCLKQYQSKVEFGFVLPKCVFGTLAV